jgi:hypothetical protein
MPRPLVVKNVTESMDLDLSPPVRVCAVVLIVFCKLLSRVLCVVQTNRCSNVQVSVLPRQMIRCRLDVMTVVAGLSLTTVNTV